MSKNEKIELIEKELEVKEAEVEIKKVEIAHTREKGKWRLELESKQNIRWVIIAITVLGSVIFLSR